MAGPTRRGVILGAAATPLLMGAGASDPVQAAVEAAFADGATSVLIARRDEVLAERYAPDWPADRPREVASVAKSILAVLLAMAVEDGAIRDFDRPAADWIPAWRGDDRRAITLRHLMSMTSGLDDAGLALRGVTGDQFALNAAAPLRDAPGTRWAYNTAASHLLFHVLARATGETVDAYAGRHLLGPLGMDGTVWVTNAGRGADGPVTNWYSAACTARDLRRFGTMVLAGGRGLISPGSLAALTAPSQALNPSYGLLWWSNALPGVDATGRLPGRRFPDAPHDVVAALGAGGQALMLVPSRGLIVIRQGDPPRRATGLADLL
ncbi:MAG: beta-lactamase family protein, partial [Alphaproteobacteria bacterium]|nr:beta-lactamase family protein [Alphaproteobacteria bacterium]